MRKFTVAATAIALGSLVGCGQSSPTRSAADVVASDCGPGPVSSSLIRTATYELTANAGPLESTYTRAQVDSTHPDHGEMMVGGSMTDVPGMPMGGGAGSQMMSKGPGGAGMPGYGGAADPSAYRHVEVHICNRASGKVVQQASPSLSLVDRSAHDATQQIPVAVMQGVHSGMADMHYGNNAHMVRGHRYMLDVTMKGEHAQFELDR